MKRNVSVALSGVFLFLFGSLLMAQEAEKKQNFVTLSTWKVKFDQLDDYLKMWEKTKSITEKNEFIKSSRVFTHYWGPDWTVLLINEYESFADIDKAQKRRAELMKEMFPDEAELEKFNKKMQSMVKGHWDAIVREVMNLRK